MYFHYKASNINNAYNFRILYIFINVYIINIMLKTAPIFIENNILHTTCTLYVNF